MSVNSQYRTDVLIDVKMTPFFHPAGGFNARQEGLQLFLSVRVPFENKELLSLLKLFIMPDFVDCCIKENRIN